jgi:signal transduction histidine kinase
VRRWLPWVVVAGAILGIAAEWVGYGWGRPGHWLPDLVTGWLLITCGVAASSVRARNPCGPLLAATGFTWFAGNFAAAALYLHRGPLCHLVLAYPGLSLAPGRARVVIAGAYVAALVPAVWRSATVTLALSAVLVATAVAVHAEAVGRERRASGYAVRATAFLAAVLAATAVVRLSEPTQAATDATLLAYEAALCLLGVALLAGLVRAPWERAPVTDLVVELGEGRSGSLRETLAGALGDPALEIGYRVGDGYVDAEGEPLVLPPSGSGRRVTAVERDGQTIAVLVHDPAVLDDPGVSEALATAARLAASNARLQAELRAQVTELSASRRRLLSAADDERRRLEQRLRDTVEERLARLAQMLEGTEAGEEQLAQTRASLRQLAAGLHPGGLQDGGLSVALASLAGRSPVPIELDLPDAVLPVELATAAYFVCSEAIANVVKHARASRASISVAVDEGQLRVVVSDDGVGGADPLRGSGLRGLADRVEALGGTIRVDSEPGRGTNVTAELPLVRE